jgi:hypothetical protein
MLEFRTEVMMEALFGLQTQNIIVASIPIKIQIMPIIIRGISKGQSLI